MNVQNFIYIYTSIFKRTGNLFLFRASVSSALIQRSIVFRYASCDLRKHHNYISYVTYVFDLCIFNDISWNFSWRYISVRMFFFDMFSGDIFSIESLFTNCTLKSCEIQMSVIMTLQIFFIPKILWRRIWFDYWK